MILATGILASAEKTDPFDTGLTFPLIALGVIVVAGLLVLVIVVLARSRFHPKAGAISSVAILWGLILTGSILYIVNAQLQWSKERALMLQGGYIDAYKALEAPAWPWKLWIGLAVAYTMMAVYSRLGGKPAPDDNNGMK